MSSVYDHLDLLALSIGADLVDITGENRILAHHGMRKLRKTMRPGIRTMLQVANIERVPNTVRDISFTLGPRINAAGRVGHALKAVELLMASDDNTAYELAYELESMNQARRDLDEDMTEEALAPMAEQPPAVAAPWCVAKGGTEACSASWQAVLWSTVPAHHCLERGKRAHDGQRAQRAGRGHPRSLGRLPVVPGAIWGHPMAAGLTLRSDQLHEFKNAIEKSIASQVNGRIPAPSISYHLEIDLNAMTPEVYEEMGRLAPFGPGNGVPVFMASRLVAALPPRTVGHRGRHLKLILQSADSPQQRLEAIGLGWATAWRGASDERDGRGVHLGPKHVPGRTSSTCTFGPSGRVRRLKDQGRMTVPKCARVWRIWASISTFWANNSRSVSTDKLAP